MPINSLRALLVVLAAAPPHPARFWLAPFAPVFSSSFRRER